MPGLLSGVLPAVYGASDKLKRNVNTLLADPSAFVEKFASDAADSQKQIGDLQAVAYPMPGQRSVLITPEQQDAARSELAQWGANMGLLGLGIDPRAQKTLVQGLLGVGNAERYRLGDITKSQARQILEYDKSASPSVLDVYVSPKAEQHVLDKRVVKQGFAPEKMGLVARQALRSDSDVFPATGADAYPYLFSKRMSSMDSGESYNAMMHLRPVEDGFEMVTVYPKGLQKGKTPKP
jgi:hypothetical protein